jgi:carbamoyl-phosphate synthase large subunit
MVINTVEEKRTAIQDSYHIRRASLTDQVPTFTTIAGARAVAIGLDYLPSLNPCSLQSLHERLPAHAPASPAAEAPATPEPARAQAAS